VCKYQHVRSADSLLKNEVLRGAGATTYLPHGAAAAGCDFTQWAYLAQRPLRIIMLDKPEKTRELVTALMAAVPFEVQPKIRDGLLDDAVVRG
jgi:hypothetical protein